MSYLEEEEEGGKKKKGNNKHEQMFPISIEFSSRIYSRLVPPLRLIHLSSI